MIAGPKVARSSGYVYFASAKGSAQVAASSAPLVPRRSWVTRSDRPNQRRRLQGRRWKLQLAV